MAFPVSCVNSVNMSALPQLAAISRERAGDSVRPTKSPALKPILVLSAPKLDAVELASINTIAMRFFFYTCYIFLWLCPTFSRLFLRDKCLNVFKVTKKIN